MGSKYEINSNYLELLCLREMLLYWRGIKTDFARARELWNTEYRMDFVRKVKAGYRPNLTTGYFDKTPLLRVNTRRASLVHDIMYLIGGGKRDRYHYDRRWAIIVKQDNKHMRGYALAFAGYRILRAVGWRHFCFCDYPPKQCYELLYKYNWGRPNA